MNLAEVQILIVDDVNTMRILTKSVLNKLGFLNTSSVDGTEAAKTALSIKRFDLILCDWYMTPVDGMELLKYVRRVPELKNIPFIMVTAETTVEKVSEAIVAGVDDYIIKPYSQDQILTKVCGILNRKR